MINTTQGVVRQVGVCSPAVNPLITPVQACINEFIISLFLVLTCCGVWDYRNAARHDSAPIKFGLMIAVLAFSGVSKYTRSYLKIFFKKIS